MALPVFGKQRERLYILFFERRNNARHGKTNWSQFVTGWQNGVWKGKEITADIAQGSAKMYPEEDRASNVFAGISGSPYGNRTHVAGMKILCPNH
jgi:hypothetical protein